MSLSHIHDEYPRDGSDTMRDDYEAICPTDTVGRYKSALKRVSEKDGTLPVDFGHYLKRRIPTVRHIEELPDNVILDRRGVARG